MLKNSAKLIFFLMMVMSSLMIISSTSWFSIWMGLEINLISFISFIIFKNNTPTIEASILYFIIQSLASILFLISIILYSLKWNMYFFFNISNELIILSLLIKIGSAPLHFWIPLVMSGLNWMSNYLLMTWQKLGPLIMLYTIINQKFLLTFIILSTMMGALGGLNQTSIKKLMSFSSINQISWLLSSLIISKTMFKIYYSFYFFITYNTLMIFNMLSLNNLNQLFNMNIMNKMILLFLFMNIFSMGGLPPFLGFYPKMMVIMVFENKLLMFVIIVFTLITLFYYLRIFFFCLFMNFLKLNKILKKNKSMISLNLNMLTSLTFMMNFFLMVFILS